ELWLERQQLLGPVKLLRSLRLDERARVVVRVCVFPEKARQFWHSVHQFFLPALPVARLQPILPHWARDSAPKQCKAPKNLSSTKWQLPSSERNFATGTFG